VDEQKKETKYEINSLNDIFLYTEQLKKAVTLFDKTVTA
jgi:hypothetical protein